ncbi:MAG: glycosyltransferase [Planctomycetota bacterium]|nr:glycosyltransferase [Planctomycetota bacterium]
MKIVHYLSEVVLAHGGVVRSVLDLCAALARAEHTVHLLCFDDRDVPPEWKRQAPLTPRAHTLAQPQGLKPLRQFKKADTLRAEGIIAGARALHLHGPWEATNPQLADIARGRAVPYVVSVHGMLDDWTIRQGHLKKRLYLSLKGRAFLDRAAAVHCTAQAELEQASRWFNPARARVLPLIIDLSLYRTPAPADAIADAARAIQGPQDAPILLFLSRLHVKKGLEHLIDASALLASQGIANRLAIAGVADDPAYEHALRARVARAGIESSTTFLGLVTGPRKAALFQAARASALPTSQENWGFSLLESLACAVPVVTTRAVDIWNELEQSGGAVICEQTPRAFADALRPLLTDPARAASMGAAARRWVLSELDAAAVLRRYEDLYRSL